MFLRHVTLYVWVCTKLSVKIQLDISPHSRLKYPSKFNWICAPSPLDEELLWMHSLSQQGHYKQQLPPLSRHIGDRTPTTSYMCAILVPEEFYAWCFVCLCNKFPNCLRNSSLISCACCKQIYNYTSIEVKTKVKIMILFVFVSTLITLSVYTKSTK